MWSFSQIIKNILLITIFPLFSPFIVSGEKVCVCVCVCMCVCVCVGGWRRGGHITVASS